MALDLDAVQARAQRVKDWRWQTPEIGMGKLWAAVEESQADIPTLVAELRAAREVMRAAQEHKSELLWACTCGCVERALAAYDKIVGEVPR